MIKFGLVALTVSQGATMEIDPIVEKQVELREYEDEIRKEYDISYDLMIEQASTESGVPMSELYKIDKNDIITSYWSNAERLIKSEALKKYNEHYTSKLEQENENKYSHLTKFEDANDVPLESRCWWFFCKSDKDKKLDDYRLKLSNIANRKKYVENKSDYYTEEFQGKKIEKKHSFKIPTEVSHPAYTEYTTSINVLGGNCPSEFNKQERILFEKLGTIRGRQYGEKDFWKDGKFYDYKYDGHLWWKKNFRYEVYWEGSKCVNVNEKYWNNTTYFNGRYVKNISKTNQTKYRYAKYKKFIEGKETYKTEYTHNEGTIKVYLPGTGSNEVLDDTIEIDAGKKSDVDDVIDEHKSKINNRLSAIKDSYGVANGVMNADQEGINNKNKKDLKISLIQEKWDNQKKDELTEKYTGILKGIFDLVNEHKYNNNRKMMIELIGYSMGGKLALSIISEATKDFNSAKKYNLSAKAIDVESYGDRHLLDAIVKVKTHQAPISYDERYKWNVAFLMGGIIKTQLNDWFRSVYDYNSYDELENNWNIATQYNKYLHGESVSASYNWWTILLYNVLVDVIAIAWPAIKLLSSLGVSSLVTFGDGILYTASQENKKLNNFKHVENKEAGFTVAHMHFKPKAADL